MPRSHLGTTHPTTIPSHLDTSHVGILVARVTKDANDNVMPVALSHMLAAEGDLSVGSHMAAEVDLIGLGTTSTTTTSTTTTTAATMTTTTSTYLCVSLFAATMNDPKRVTLMDRSRCLEGQTERQLPNTSILTCYRHLKQELLASAAGRDSMEIFDKLALLPQCRHIPSDPHPIPSHPSLS